jgi:hypothetical protein
VYAFLRTLQRVDEKLQRITIFAHNLQLGDSILQRVATHVDDLIGSTQLLDSRLVETATLLAYSIDRPGYRGLAANDHIGRYIVIDMCHATDHRVSTDLEKLVYTSIAAKNGPVIDFHMA